MSAAERVKLTTYRWQAATPNLPWIQPIARMVASTSADCADTLRQEKQECAIRLLGGPCADPREEFGVLGLGGFQREREARTGRRGRGVDGEGTADPGGGVLQRTERVVGVDHRRVPGHLRG